MSGSETKARSALVTGAARGLGRAMALGLAAKGYDVAACDLPSAEAELVALMREAAGAKGKVLPVLVDVSDNASCTAGVERAVETFGKIDILVNNAGFGMERVTNRIHDGNVHFYHLREEFWAQMIDVNLNGAFRMARLVAPLQIENKWGRIVNVTTSFATMVRQGFSPYGPSKAGLEAATAIWAQDLRGSGVTANVLIPGAPVDTRLIPVEDVSDRSRLLPPDVMVPPLLWLLSDQADAVTGRRFIAKQWDDTLPHQEAAKAAGAPAAWDVPAVW